MIYKYDIFLSYATEDKQFAEKLHSKLREIYSVWYDRVRIQWGDGLESKILEGLKNSKYGIVILSHAYLNPDKKWTKWEFDHILKNQKIRCILHKISEKEIKDNYPNVYKVIEKWRYIDSADSTDFILQQAKRAIGEDSLCSEKKVDYTRLRNLLRQKKWKKADLETLSVMLKAANRKKEGSLSSESIENFPCTDLCTIDRLWEKYSHKHFGFSVQESIWESVGGNYYNFAERVGWRDRFWLKRLWKGEWISYEDVNFDTSANKGHLPVACFGERPPWTLYHRVVWLYYWPYNCSWDYPSVWLYDVGRRAFSDFYSRIQTCKA